MRAYLRSNRHRRSDTGSILAICNAGTNGRDSDLCVDAVACNCHLRGAADEHLAASKSDHGATDGHCAAFDTYSAAPDADSRGADSHI